MFCSSRTRERLSRISFNFFPLFDLLSVCFTYQIILHWNALWYNHGTVGTIGSDGSYSIRTIERELLFFFVLEHCTKEQYTEHFLFTLIPFD